MVVHRRYFDSDGGDICCAVLLARLWELSLLPPLDIFEGWEFLICFCQEFFRALDFFPLAKTLRQTT